MGTTPKDKMARLTPERRGSKPRRTGSMPSIKRSRSCAKRRSDAGAACKSLGIRQAAIAQLEKRSDLMLTTLRSYVKAMAAASGLRSSRRTRRRSLSKGLGHTDEPRAGRHGPGDEAVEAFAACRPSRGVWQSLMHREDGRRL
jgi:hypothetical protein